MAVKLIRLMLVFAVVSSSTIAPALVLAQTPKPATTSKPTQPAKTPPDAQRRTSRPVFVWSKTPPRLSTISGRVVGMGSRDDCPWVKTPLLALVPHKQRALVNKQLDVWGLTIAERPTFWFYLPYTQDFAVRAEFVLQDNQENDVYRSAIALPATPGIINVALPATIAPLQIAKTYRWYFKVYCDRSFGTPPIYVEGDIQRVNLNPQLVQQLAATNVREKITTYAAAGIWYDALTLLAQQRQANPNDLSLAADWQSLLQSIDLGNVAKTPLIISNPVSYP